jgi:3-oxoacyl-[acyl-carrier protein] reductase
MRIAKKVAIVTGSGRGIGAAVVSLFAREGAKVVVTDVDQEPAEEVAAAIRSGGGEAIAVRANVSDRDEVNRLVEEAMRAFGTIDILVNNAGITRPAMIERMTEADWRAVLDVNLTGAFWCTQAVGRVFLDRAKRGPAVVSPGKIVNVISVAGLRGTVGQANYAASKAGLVALTMSAAREWGRLGINVNGVAFGLVETRMTEKIRTDPRFKEKYMEQIALGRYAKAEDVVPAVLFLASSEADYVTGQILNVCGGVDIHA